MALIAAAAAVAAFLAGCSAPPAGATWVYRDGSGSVRLAAGTERETFDLDRSGEGRFTRNRAFRFGLSGARGRLSVEVTGVRGTGQYAGPEVGVRLVFLGREFPSTKGGACSVGIRRADAVQASGSVTCVGLGTIGGKGYDVGAEFRLLS